MSSLLFRLKAYLQYRFKAQNAHDLHSPFVFELYQKVIKKKDTKTNRELLCIRNRFTSQNENITFVDPKSGRKETTSTRSLVRRVSSSHKFSCFLFRLVNYLGYKKVLETGTSLGITTAYLNQSAADIIVSIEGSGELHTLARRNLNSYDPHKVVLIHGKVRDVFGETLTKYQPELVFLDADHRRETIEFYMEELKLCSSTKCIILHDIHWSEDMELAWQKIIENSHYNLTIDLFQAGIIFPDYPIEKQHFSLKF